MGIIWEEAEVAAQNRSEWGRSVAQCIHFNVGLIKVKVKLIQHNHRYNTLPKRSFGTVLVGVVRVRARREVASPLTVLADEVMPDGRRRVITWHGHG